MKLRPAALALLALLWAGATPLAPAAPAPQLRPGATFSVRFPELPPNLADMMRNRKDKPMMTVFLPTNYDRQRRHPLLIFLGGGTGGLGGNPEIARKLSEERDFICVNLPLFKAALDPALPTSASRQMIFRDEDCKFMWPIHKKMLERLEAIVPNIDPDRRVLGGFSNGGHSTGGMIEQSGGEVARRFSAFLLVEGGQKLAHYELIKGKPVMILYGGNRGRGELYQQILATAQKAGAKATLYEMKNTGHAFPVKDYAAVRAWLREAIK